MLRSAFIMAALDAGVPLRDVQTAARHSDPRTTTIYDRRRQNFDRHAAYVERSEEHTSELQSLMRISYAVFCLNNKKKHKRQSLNHIQKCEISQRSTTDK